MDKIKKTYLWSLLLIFIFLWQNYFLICSVFTLVHWMKPVYERKWNVDQYSDLWTYIEIYNYVEISKIIQLYESIRVYSNWN